MPKFDKTLPNGVELIDFSHYAQPKEVLAYAGWPARLVSQPDIAATLKIEAELESGWLPGAAELNAAPKLMDWSYIDGRANGQGLYLTGRVTGHPNLNGQEVVIETSHVAAVDGATHKWARTLSRWYRLGRQA